MNADGEIEGIKYTLRILDEKVGELPCSIRVYVEYLVERRAQERLDEFHRHLEEGPSELESRLWSLEKRVREET